MAIPQAALDAIKETLISVDDLQTNILKFLSMVEPDVIAQLPPLQRARAFLVLAQCASTLLSVRLRCCGIQPDEHPIRTEIERLSLCEGKLEKFCYWDKAPLRASTTINRQAATRFIEHSLPDLTPGQRRSMRKISSEEGTQSIASGNYRFQKKRKHSSFGRQSVCAAAQEFLEKARRELLGSSDSGVKGPLRHEICDEEGDDECVR